MWLSFPIASFLALPRPHSCLLSQNSLDRKRQGVPDTARSLTTSTDDNNRAGYLDFRKFLVGFALTPDGDKLPPIEWRLPAKATNLYACLNFVRIVRNTNIWVLKGDESMHYMNENAHIRSRDTPCTSSTLFFLTIL